MIKQLCVGALIAITLGACGGGGGSASTAAVGSDVQLSKAAFVSSVGTILPKYAVSEGSGQAFRSDASFIQNTNPGTSNQLDLQFDVVASAVSPNQMVFNLALATLDAGAAGTDLNAELMFDSSWMTFTGFTVGANAADVSARLEQASANTLVIGATGVQQGVVAVLTFTVI